jgi:hypothetical protein
VAIKPTASLIAGKTLKEIIWNPYVYVPYAVLAVTNAIMPIHPWMNIPAAIAITAGHIWYWRRNWDFLYQKHEFNEEVSYRKSQNAELKKRFDSQTSDKIPPSHRAGMVAALQAKAEIELQIFEDGNITFREHELLETIEQTIHQMIEVLETATSKEPPAEFSAALDILMEIRKNFQHVTRPVFPTTEENHTNVKTELAESTKALKNRIDEATRIRSIAIETREKTQ